MLDFAETQTSIVTPLGGAVYVELMAMGRAMLTVVECGAAAAIAVIVLYVCDIARSWFFANPDPHRGILIRLLRLLALFALVGLYVVAMVGCVAGSVFVYGVLAQAADWNPNPGRVVFAVAIVVGMGVASVIRRKIAKLANRRQFAAIERVLPPHAGASETWFVAMQYYALILNRTYKVFITDTMLCGAHVRGLVMSPPAVSSDQLDRDYWANTLLGTLYELLDVTSPKFLSQDWANFQIRWSEIARIDFDASKKWGMGNVPYSGRIFIRLKSGRSKELILLGQQAGPQLRDALESARTCAG